ncbi:MAG: M12 family metallo-peptidase [Pseudomonadota bacterium]
MLCLSLGARAQELRLPITVEGVTYTAVLQLNQTLLDKLVVSDDDSALHFAGKLLSSEDSWVRLSNIEGVWQGLVSIAGETHTVEGRLMHSFARSGNAITSLSASRLTPLGELGHSCAADQIISSPFINETTAQHLRQSTFNLPQALNFDELCTNTVVDSNGDELCLLAEIEFAFDELFQADFGATATSQAVSLINLVDGIYRNDLNTAFEALTVTMLDSDSDVFSTTTNASSLLTDIANKKSSNSIPFLTNRNALFHLVTGREFNGSTVGIAFVGSLCAAGAASGTSELIGSGNGRIPLTSVVVAHELGHNFGGGHDSVDNACGQGFIMFPSVDPSATGFSSCSLDEFKGEIDSINNLAACFDFPVDFALSELSGNPDTLTADQSQTVSFLLTPSSASENVSNGQLSGSIQRGTVSTATLDGQGCTVASNQLSFSCAFGDITQAAPLQVTLVAQQDPLDLALNIDVDGGDIRDVLTANNSLDAQYAVTGQPNGDDTVPDSFSFDAQDDVDLNQILISNTVVISGINTQTLVTVSNGEYSVNNGAFGSQNGFIQNGSSVRVRHTSSGQELIATTTTLTVGSVAAAFTSTTRAAPPPPPDTTPDPFQFSDQVGVEVSSTITSDNVTVAGIDAATEISVTGGSYSVNSGAFTSSSGNVLNGDRVRIRHTSSGAFLTRVDTTLNIGGVSDVFSSITRDAPPPPPPDNSPDSFSFTTLVDVETGSELVSNTIVISGINTATAISIFNGEYSVNGAAFTANSGTVEEGDSLRVRQIAAATPSTSTITQIQIGDFSTGFESITRSNDDNDDETEGDDSGDSGDESDDSDSEDDGGTTPFDPLLFALALLALKFRSYRQPSIVKAR